MIQPYNFCVSTVLAEHKSVAVPEIKVNAIDIGYSAVKCFTASNHACFPAFARKVDAASIIGDPNPDDILYRDESGTWVVGASALRDIRLSDTNDSEATLYARQRYDSDMFRVIYRVGMGLCLLDEKGIASGGRRPIFLQTGLPPAYIKSDRRDLTEALSGTHLYAMKFGRKQWKEFLFELPENNIDIMPQPMGSLFSAAISNECKPIQGAADYFKSSILGFDPGFGTADTFEIRGGAIKSFESFDNLGMKIVYKRLADRIHRAYGEFVPTHAIQKVLLDGFVQVFDKKKMATVNQPVTDLLEQCSREVCEEALNMLKTTYNYLREFKYLLITGGTGEAWKGYITEHFSGMRNLHIVMGNQNDPALPQIFSNARGYYLKRVGTMKAHS